MASGNIGVTQGEKCPLAVKVLPASIDYKDFVINSEGTKIVIMNNYGVIMEESTQVSIDADNQTVMYSWDTSNYDVGSYTLIFWVSITYNNTDFLIKSNTISKSIKKQSITG